MMARCIYIILVFSLVFAVDTEAAEFPELEDYIEQALSSNLQIKQIMQTIQEKEQSKNIARANFYPHLNFDSRYSFAGGGRNIEIDPANIISGDLPPGFSFGDPISVKFLREREHDTKFSLLQPLFTGGLIKSSYHASIMDYNAARAELNSVKENIIYEVSRAYYNYLMTEELIEIARENLNLAEEHLSVAKALFEAELVTRNEIFRAEVAVASAEQNLEEAKYNQNIARIYFNNLLNLPVESEVKNPEINTELDDLRTEQFENKDLSEYKNTARINRAELKQLEFNSKSLEYLKTSAKSKYYPNLSLSAAYGWEGEKYQFDFQHDYWMISFLLNFKVFDAGIRKSKIKQIDAQKNRLNYVYASMMNYITLEVSEAFYNLTNTMNLWKSAKKQYLSAEENYNILEVQYESGLASQIEYLDARNLYMSSKNNLAILYYRLLSASAALDKACGKGMHKYSSITYKENTSSEN